MLAYNALWQTTGSAWIAREGPEGPLCLLLAELQGSDEPQALTLLPGGTAEGLAAKLAKSGLPPERIERIALTMLKDMLTGVAALHDEGLAHLDLKPKNLFIDRSGNFFVADFGSARHLQDLKQGNRLEVGAPLYEAPELIVQTNLSKAPTGKKVDELRVMLQKDRS
jgi:serine/threonine protein kinase